MTRFNMRFNNPSSWHGKKKLPPGSLMIRISSGFFIIFAVFGLFSEFNALFNVAETNAESIVPYSFAFYHATFFIIALFELVLGFLGIKFHAIIEKSRLLMQTGIFYAVVAAIWSGVALHFYEEYPVTHATLVSAIIFVSILPALYIFGAVRNHRSLPSA